MSTYTHQTDQGKFLASLQSMMQAHLPEGGVAIINQDEPFFQQWLQQAGKASVVTFSKYDTSANYYASNIHIQKNASTVFELTDRHLVKFDSKAFCLLD